jgi:hypothetical protein
MMDCPLDKFKDLGVKNGSLVNTFVLLGTLMAYS